MDVPDANKVRDAEQRWDSGDILGAISLYLDVCMKGRDNRARLHCALLLVDQLKPVDRLPELLQICDVGIECARKLSDPLLEAYLRGKKAENLAFFNGLNFVGERVKLRMAP